MPALSHISPTPRSTTESMITSWKRTRQISEKYAAIAYDVIDRVERFGTDKAGNYTIDYALVRALARLDKEGVYIVPTVRNIQMGADRLLDFVSQYDPEQAGELTIVKDASKLKCTPECVAMMLTTIIVNTSCLYALKMNKREEVNRYLAIVNAKNGTHRSRVWLQEELQEYLRRNRRFSEDKYIGDICQYITKPTRRTVIEQKERLW